MEVAQKQQWNNSIVEAPREMLKLAATGQKTSYTELAKSLTTQYAPNGKPFAKLLSEISEQTFKRYGVLLSAVVVRSDTGIPGDGFFELAERLNLNVAEPRDFWEKAVEAVFKQYKDPAKP